MALTAAEQRDVLRQILLVAPGLGQTFSKPDLLAAIVAADTWLLGNRGASSTNTGFNTVFVSPFSTASVVQKTVLSIAVQMKQAGLI